MAKPEDITLPENAGDASEVLSNTDAENANIDFENITFNEDETVMEEEDEEEESAFDLTVAEAQALQLLLQKVSHRAHPTSKAKKSEMKKLMKDTHIITESADSKVQTEKTMLKDDMEDLQASANVKRILSGTIVGVKSANAANNVATNFAIVRYGHGACQVLIPDYLLFNFDVTINRTADRQQRIKAKISSMIGTEVKFIVRHFDAKTLTAWSDRLLAMEQEGYNNYIRPLNNTKRQRIKVGDMVQGVVTAVSRTAVTVYALGSECKINQSSKVGEKGEFEVSWHYVPDCRTLFKPNMVVNVKVLAIEINKVNKYGTEYSLIATKLSIKQATQNPQVRYFDSFNEDELYQATITGIVDNKVYCLLAGKVECLCEYPRYGSRPYIGETRVVEIHQKFTSDEQGNTVDKNGQPIRRIFGVFKDV